MMSSESILDESVAELIDAVASDEPTLGGGAVSGTVAALAAGLAAMAGRYALKRDVPFALGALAAEVAAVGEQLADSGNPHLRSDACAATLLGSAVAASTAILVRENLRGRPGDGRVAAARKHAIDAAAAARTVVAPNGLLPDRISR
jgi:formiminotetrahydrofolate cyclodeaminase